MTAHGESEDLPWDTTLSRLHSMNLLVYLGAFCFGVQVALLTVKQKSAPPPPTGKQVESPLTVVDPEAAGPSAPIVDRGPLSILSGQN